MSADPSAPLFVDPRQLLLVLAREHALPGLLRLVVDRLAESPRVALARVWLVQKSEDCTGCLFFFSSRRRHTSLTCDWSSDVCSSDLIVLRALAPEPSLMPMARQALAAATCRIQSQ